MMDTAGRIVMGQGGAQLALTREAVRAMLEEAIAAWGGPPRKLLILPPDITRAHSGAGEITSLLYELLGERSEIDIMPALGTHSPMTPEELREMFPGVPLERFLTHDWRGGTALLGEVPASFIHELSEGKMNAKAEARVNRRLIEGGYDMILSVGQVVPHEVVGLANHNKNILVGVGGPDFISKSHYLGAVYGMERMMGRADTPVRRLFDYAERHFLGHLPIKYALTVKGIDDKGRLCLRGLFIGEGKAPFDAAAELAVRTNLDLLERPIKKAVVYLDPQEYRSTWLGNKAIYRLRMAMADGGELIVLAPGVKMFGEDRRIDELVRRYGYRGTPHTLDCVERHEELRQNLSVAAHLIHGSSEGRFRITYAPGGLSREEIETAGYQYASWEAMSLRYDPKALRRGYNVVDGEEIFFVDNPSLGLWALAEKFLEPAAARA